MAAKKKRKREDTKEARTMKRLEAKRHRQEATLLREIKARLPELRELLEEVDDVADDLVYRFFHQSWKVYGAQDYTERAVVALQALMPEIALNEWFRQIVKAGTGREFTPEHNGRWLEVTRPMLEAFWHARYFLAMVVEYGAELDEPQSILPSGWAAVLYLYGLR
ncbi:MAG: hypothetical protein ACRELB_02010 [Polyangiaceae bacterium]